MMHSLILLYCLTAPQIPKLPVHPHYIKKQQTHFLLTSMVSVHADSFGFIGPGFEICV